MYKYIFYFSIEEFIFNIFKTYGEHMLELCIQTKEICREKKYIPFYGSHPY